MNGLAIALGAAGVGAAIGGLTSVVALRRKGLHRWLGEYIRTAKRRRDYHAGEPLEIIFAICDHYEPSRGGVSMAKARSRVQEWLDKYPALFDRFRDSFGNPPQHSFFYPADEYEPELVEMVATLCRKGYGDVEIHLHHDRDTADGFREKLETFKTQLHNTHGLLAKDPTTGQLTYGFIHGNWCLNNSRSDGRHCGVNNEIGVLLETGCYADFTMPSAPSETQTQMINSIYWASEDPKGRPKAHNTGVRVGEGPRPPKSLLMIQGPLLLDWSQRKFGLLPSIENGNLQKSQPPSKNRLELWLRAAIKVSLCDNRLFVKLHTHGVHEPNQEVLLGPAMVGFHEVLGQLMKENQNLVFRYVTARQMAASVLEAVESASVVPSSSRVAPKPPKGTQ